MLSYLGLPEDVPVPQPRTGQQADAVNDEWVMRFLSASPGCSESRVFLVAHLRGCPPVLYIRYPKVLVVG